MYRSSILDAGVFLLLLYSSFANSSKFYLKSILTFSPLLLTKCLPDMTYSPRCALMFYFDHISIPENCVQCDFVRFFALYSQASSSSAEFFFSIYNSILIDIVGIFLVILFFNIVLEKEGFLPVLARTMAVLLFEIFDTMEYCFFQLVAFLLDRKMCLISGSMV